MSKSEKEKKSHTEQDEPAKKTAAEEEAEKAGEQTAEQPSEPGETEKLQRELAAQKELCLRTAAEYDNFRKRTEREKAAIYRDAVAAAVTALLPVADSLERALEIHEGKAEDYAKGIELTVTQLRDALTKLKVEPVGAAGEPFDPILHNAVAHVEDEAAGENTIVEVFQKGYKMEDKVIRHAMVKVAN